MSDNINQEKANEYYNQCSNIYANYVSGHDPNNEIPLPDPMDDYFSVPAELLFIELCKNDKGWANHRPEFDKLLIGQLYKNKEWNIEDFKFTPRNVKGQKYIVYLELFYIHPYSRSRLFSNPINIDGVIIESCTKKTYKVVYDRYISCESMDRLNKNNLYASGVNIVSGVKRRYLNIDKDNEKNVHPIKVTVYSEDKELSALNLAIDKVKLLVQCLNAAQNIAIRELKTFGYDPDSLKKQIVVAETGRILIEGGERFNEYYTPSTMVKIPTREYDNSNNKKLLLDEILQAVTDGQRCLKDRIRFVLQDLYTAYNSDNAGSRMLSYWRCLEHTTRKNGETRKEKEIIKIFKKRYSNRTWEEMGDLVVCARNQFVHKGIHAGGQEYGSNYLKWTQQYAEQSLTFLLYLYKNRDVWKNEEDLNMFFDIFQRSPKELMLSEKIFNLKKIITNNR